MSRNTRTCDDIPETTPIGPAYYHRHIGVWVHETETDGLVRCERDGCLRGRTIVDASIHCLTTRLKEFEENRPSIGSCVTCTVEWGKFIEARDRLERIKRMYQGDQLRYESARKRWLETRQDHKNHRNHRRD